jgi:hypothetical protein
MHHNSSQRYSLRKGLVLALSALVFFADCVHGDNYPQTYPLRVGNSWSLVHGRMMLEMTAEDSVLENNLTFFVLTEIYMSEGDTVFRRSSLFRQLRNGNIQSKIVNCDAIMRKQGSTQGDLPNGGLSEWYKFDVPAGSAWIAYSNSSMFSQSMISPYRITCESVNDTIQIDGQTYPRCWRFLIDELPSSDEEYRDWIADGIGVVKREFISGKQPYLLQKVHLNR